METFGPMSRTLPIALIALALSGCETMMSHPFAQEPRHPLPSEIQSSTPLDVDDAKKQAEIAMGSLLKDPYSAHWDCYEPKWITIGSGKAWGGQDLTGWTLPCDINSKNSYGAYAGATHYAFLFIDQRLRRAVELGSSGVFATQRVIYDN